MLHLADTQETLTSGNAQAILALVVLALVVALVAVVRHHLAYQDRREAWEEGYRKQCADTKSTMRLAWDQERAASLDRERQLHHEQLELSQRVLRSVEFLAGLEEKPA